MQSRTRSTVPTRRGVTLLFTVSMLVLFLMMGTAFMVVANNYFRSSVRRSRHSSINRDTAAWLDQAFYDAVRGPGLNNSISPLRGHSILEDLYGYGIKGRLSDSVFVQPTSDGALLVLQLNPASLSSIRDGVLLEDFLSSPDYVDGLFNGRVISVTSGQASGYSTRIVSHAVIESEDASLPDMLQVVIPRDETGIQWSNVGTGDEFVINGREFSGFGAGEIATHAIDPDGLPEVRLVSDDDGTNPVDLMKATPARPNRIGEPFEELIAATGYLSSDRSPNEPWDAPDQHNMFLSGVHGPDNDIIPSFHRDRLYDFQYQRAAATLGDSALIPASLIRRFSFRPTYVGSEDSTATRPLRPGHSSSIPQSWFGRYLADGSRDPEVAINSEASLDVDTDMDGKNDAVWIDIGLPDQIDADGFKYRPLVAYRIVDLDGRLNLNAHGLQGNTEDDPPARSGFGYGVAEISLTFALGGDYEALIEERNGNDNFAGSRNNTLSPDLFVAQKMLGHPLINTRTSARFATAADFFAVNTYAKLEGDDDTMPEFFAFTPVVTQNPYLSDFSLGGSGVGDSHFLAHELEGILRRNDVDGLLLGGRLNPSDATVGAVTTHSFEIAIPATTLSITELLRDRIALEHDGENQKEIFNIFTSNFFFDTKTEESFEMKYISKEMLMGGRFNLIPIIGNGIDNDLNGVVDNIDELSLGQEGRVIDNVFQTQFGSPVYDLNNDPEIDDSTTKSLMAKQLYLLALLVCGENAPDGYPNGPVGDDGKAIASNALYRQSVAQWAVNVVDFYDPDSTMTVFEYDVKPFNDPRVTANRVDGDPRTDEEAERGIVYGAERPEILITETFAHHDRQNEDTREEIDEDMADDDATGETTDDGDLDWDSRRVPQSSLYVELYHPHNQSTTTENSVQGFQTLPFELSGLRPPTNFRNAKTQRVRGVDLATVAPDSTPVWRIAVHRGPTATEADEHVRTIYFIDPVGSKAPDPGHDCFFPEDELEIINPTDKTRNYMVLGTDGNVGDGEQTFGRLTSTAEGKDATRGDIANTRAITISSRSVSIRDSDGQRIRSLSRQCVGATINQYRSGHSGPLGTRGLSLSDPNGGYDYDPADVDRGQAADGITLDTPLDTPFDAEPASGNRDRRDMEAIWTNGIKQDGDYQFRVLKLQRLADPLSDFHETANPYICVDVANVDLLSFNGMQENPSNEVEPDFDDSIGTSYSLKAPGTVMGGIERGEQLAHEDSPESARRQFYRALGRIDIDDQRDVKAVPRDGHNFSYRFTAGNIAAERGSDRHETLGTRNASYEDTNQLSWLMWNNRPYANTLELANVPMLSPEGIVRHFNRSESETDALGANEQADRAFSHFFGDDQFGHLMAFGNVERSGCTSPNRFDWIWEFVEVPSRFLGSETWLTTRNSDGEPIFIEGSGALKFNLHPPMHSIPNFRYPGKINLNTIYVQSVWDGLVRGFSDLTFEDFRADRDTVIGVSDVGRHYTTAEGAEFTDDVNALRKGAEANLFRTAEGSDKKLTDGINNSEHGDGTDVEASAPFRNEFRTRLGIAATTRSNVYAIWITIGYFEVDDLGRVGPEIGSEEGQVRRNRAFYMLDRSIPVASEPGENHNVDNAVLTRTIIE